MSELNTSENSMSAKPLLEVRDLSVVYGRVEATRNVSLTVGQGEFVSIIGSNGAGKSSTLKAIAGVVRPASGQISMDGIQIGGKDSYDVVKKGVVLVPEGRHVFADQTVEDNLLLGGYLRDKIAVEQSIDEMYQLFPILKERRSQFAGSLSGGEQQMLAIARGLLAKPRLLMIDEVSLGLAPKILQFLFPILTQLNQKGLSILLVEQLATEALAVTNRVYVMENGEITLSGDSQKLAQDPRIMEAYLGKKG